MQRVPATCYLAIKKAVEDGIGSQNEKLDKIHDRMFVDNGKKSIQSMLESHHTQLRFQWIVLTAIVVAIIGSAITVVVEYRKDMEKDCKIPAIEIRK